MKGILLLTVLALLVVLAGFVMAEPPAHGRRDFKHIWKNEDSILSNLNLTPEQLEKIHELRDSFKKELVPLRTQKYEKKAELRLLWSEPQPSREKIKAKQKELHDLIWRLINLVTDYRFTIQDILTLEQWSKFLDMGGFRFFGHRGRKSGVSRSR